MVLVFQEPGDRGVVVMVMVMVVDMWSCRCGDHYLVVFFVSFLFLGHPGGG